MSTDYLIMKHVCGKGFPAGAALNDFAVVACLLSEAGAYQQLFYLDATIDKSCVSDI